MTRFKNASYPPAGPWDARLSELACPALFPVQTLHENPWFSLRNRGGYFTVEYHLTQISVLPVIDDKWVVMVRVKRPVLDDMTLEFPAGGAESGEHPAQAAARELAEETGIVVKEISRFVPMTPIAVSSTRTPKLSYLFRVALTKEEYAERMNHDNEIYSVERIHVADLPRMMNDGTIYVSLPLAILGIYLSSRLMPALSATAV